MPIIAMRSRVAFAAMPEREGPAPKAGILGGGGCHVGDGVGCCCTVVDVDVDDSLLVDCGVFVGTGVAVGGTGVFVAGGFGVFVAGGGTGVLVGSGGTGVGVKPADTVEMLPEKRMTRPMISMTKVDVSLNVADPVFIRLLLYNTL